MQLVRALPGAVAVPGVLAVLRALWGLVCARHAPRSLARYANHQSVFTFDNPRRDRPETTVHRRLRLGLSKYSTLSLQRRRTRNETVYVREVT